MGLDGSQIEYYTSNYAPSLAAYHNEVQYHLDY